MIVQAHFHLVLTTRRRAKIFCNEMNKCCGEAFVKVIEHLGLWKKVDIIKVNFDHRIGKNDHLHVLFSVFDFAGLDIDKFVKGLKIMSRMEIQNFEGGKYKTFQWSSTYYLKTISPVGYDEAAHYIDLQHRDEE